VSLPFYSLSVTQTGPTGISQFPQGPNPAGSTPTFNPTGPEGFSGLGAPLTKIGSFPGETASPHSPTPVHHTSSSSRKALIGGLIGGLTAFVALLGAGIQYLFCRRKAQQEVVQLDSAPVEHQSVQYHEGKFLLFHCGIRIHKNTRTNLHPLSFPFQFTWPTILGTNI
jgi:hypothetical protein